MLGADLKHVSNVMAVRALWGCVGTTRHGDFGRGSLPGGGSGLGCEC